MYSSKTGLIIGFHGCDESVRDKIIAGKTMLNPSKNIYDWLGGGIYFWENNQQRAFQFVHELKSSSRTTKINKPSVIGAVIDMGFCLDLLDSDYIKIVRESYEILLASCKTLNLDMPINKVLNTSKDLLLRNLDCAVIDNVHLQRKINTLRAFDSIRGVFVEGNPLYHKAGFHEKNHIQICIRNPNCIKGFFLPREIDGRYSMP